MGETVDLHIGGYHLTENIGTGGMGSVFEATVEAQGKPVPKGTRVAVKLLHPHLRSIEEFVKRFHREARLAAKIDHPNVVPVFDAGISPDNRHHYIVMDYAEGMKLSDLMGDGVPLSPQQTIEIINQVCDALTAAANIEDPDEPGLVRSLVHRDVKPDNIIIEALDREQLDTMTRTGDKTALACIRAKLLDFGLAKDVKALSTVLSQTGQSLGTPAYMSPEQCRGGEVDQRSDLYSLGVCAYHMITGTQPFAGPTTVAYAHQHAEEIPPDVLKRNPLCPKNLADCIYRCLAKQRTDRYVTPGELQQDLARVARGQPVIKVYRFKKPRAIGAGRLLSIVGTTVAAVLVVIAAVWFLRTDRVKSGLAEAIQQADIAIAADDYTGAKSILEEALAAVPNGSDRAELVAPVNARLQKIAAQTAQQERVQAEAEAARRKEGHEQAAVAAVGDIKAKIAGGDYQDAIDASNAARGTYADTPSANQYPDLLAEATRKLKELEQNQRAAEEAKRQRQEAEARTRHERFVQYRDEGIAAHNSKDYEAAKLSFGAALEEEDSPSVRSLLQQCIDATTRHRIAVVDFSISGDVGIAEAGKSVAELLLTRLSADRYQLVERSHLAAILGEHDLTMADIASNPALLRGRKLEGVRYLVLGSMVKLGNLAISARVVDVTTGDMVQTAEVSAEDARGLQSALGELAKILQMTPEEVREQESRYQEQLQLGRALARNQRLEEAISALERALRIAPEAQEPKNLIAEARTKLAQWQRASELVGRALSLEEQDTLTGLHKAVELCRDARSDARAPDEVDMIITRLQNRIQTLEAQSKYFSLLVHRDFSFVVEDPRRVLCPAPGGTVQEYEKPLKKELLIEVTGTAKQPIFSWKERVQTRPRGRWVVCNEGPIEASLFAHEGGFSLSLWLAHSAGGSRCVIEFDSSGRVSGWEDICFFGAVLTEN